MYVIYNIGIFIGIWDAHDKDEKVKIEQAKIQKEKTENAYKYTDECRLNKECWENAFITLQKAMDEDLKDGVIDEDWGMVKYNIFENMQKLASEDYKMSIYMMFYDYFINYSSSKALYRSEYGEIYF